jgi:hypothetical protein
VQIRDRIKELRGMTWDELRAEKRAREKALPFCPCCFQSIYPGEPRHALVNEFGMIECIEVFNADS